MQMGRKVNELHHLNAYDIGKKKESYLILYLIFM